MTLQAVVGKVGKQQGKRDEISLARRVLARGEFLGSLRSWLHCCDDGGWDNRFRFSKVGLAHFLKRDFVCSVSLIQSRGA
jgi:hypothetical protein